MIGRVLGFGFLACLSACRSTDALLQDLREGDRPSRVAALRALRGNTDPGAVSAALGALDDPDLVVRWTAAKNLLALDRDRIGPALLERLPQLPIRGLRLGLEVAARSHLDIDPERLGFIVERVDPAGLPEREPLNSAGRELQRRIQRVAARVLANSSRKREAVRVLARILAKEMHPQEASELILKVGREAVAAELADFADRGYLRSYLWAALIRDPRVAELAFGGVRDHVVSEAIARLDAQDLLDRAVAALGKPVRWSELSRALAANPNLPLSRLEQLAEDSEEGARVDFLFARLQRGLDLEPGATLDFLNRFPDASSVDRAVVQVVSKRTTRGYRGEPIDLRVLGILLGLRLERPRQEVAAALLCEDTEPYVAEAERVLTDAPEIRLPWETLDRLRYRRPDLGRALLWKVLRNAEVRSELFSRALDRMIFEGGRELVDLLRRRLGAEADLDSRFIRALARAPSEGERELLLKRLENPAEGDWAPAAAALLTLGREEALVPFLSSLYQLKHEDWLKDFEDYERPDEAIHREMGRVLAALAKSRFPPASLLAAAREVRSEHRGSLLAAVIGELGGEEARTTLLGMLAETKDRGWRAEAARQLDRFPGEESIRALRRLAEEADFTTGAEAVRSLAVLEDPGLLPFLLALSRTEKGGSVEARAVLIHWGPPELAHAAARLAASDRLGDLDLAADLLVRMAPDRAETLQAVGGLLQSKGDFAHGPLLDFIRGHPELAEAARRALRSGSPRARSLAVSYLGLWGGAENLRVLAGVMDDPDREVVRSAAEVLWEREDPSALQGALARLRREGMTDGGDNLSLSLFRYATTFDHPGRLELLQEGAAKGNHSIRGVALGGLAGLKSLEAVGLILEDCERYPETFFGSFDAGSLLRLATGVNGLKTIDEWEEWLADHWSGFDFPSAAVEPWVEGGKEPERPEPFAGVKMEPLRAIRQWQGTTSEEFRGPGLFAIREEGTWKALWRRLRLPSPPADFQGHTALVVMRTDPDPANIVSFWSRVPGTTRDESGTTVYVSLEQSALKLTMVHHAGTGWHVLLVPKIEGKIAFRTAEIIRY